MLGLGSGSGPDALDLVHPDDRQRLCEFGQHIEVGTAYEIEYRVVAGQQNPKWQASRGQPIISDLGELIGLAGVTWDITDRKTAEAEIERMNASLSRLSGELLRLQDEERRRLARELHDGPVQMLSAAAMNLSMLAKSTALASAARELRLARECLDWVKQCSEGMRSLSYLLHPPILDELGLTSALRGWVAGYADRTGLDVDLELDEVGRLGADSETALFRIAQEALVNVHRHSRSSTVAVRLHRSEGSIQLEVEDHGCGIPPAEPEKQNGHRIGVGIQGMRERARQLGGRLEIDSRPGAGTVVRVLLPGKAGA